MPAKTYQNIGQCHIDQVINFLFFFSRQGRRNIFSITPYAYSMIIPSSLMDPDGRNVDIRNLKDDDHKKALLFLKTKNWQAFIASYLKKGQSLTITIGKKNHVGDTVKEVLYWDGKSSRTQKTPRASFYR